MNFEFKNEATRANLQKKERILKWRSFWNKVYSSALHIHGTVSGGGKKTFLRPNFFVTRLDFFPPALTATGSPRMRVARLVHYTSINVKPEGEGGGELDPGHIILIKLESFCENAD